MSSKNDSPKAKSGTEMPKCPICGRRKSVRKSGDDYYCDHCREMFRA